MASNSALPNLFRGRSDAELNLWNAGSAVTAGATATSAILDLTGGNYTTAGGDTYGRMLMFGVILDFADIATSGGTDTLTINVQLSNASDFGSGNVTIMSRLFAQADNDSHPRRVVFGAINQDHVTNYRYLRVQIVSANNGAATFGGYVVPFEG